MTPCKAKSSQFHLTVKGALRKFLTPLSKEKCFFRLGVSADKNNTGRRGRISHLLLQKEH